MSNSRPGPAGLVAVLVALSAELSAAEVAEQAQNRLDKVVQSCRADIVNEAVVKVCSARSKEPAVQAWTLSKVSETQTCLGKASRRAHCGIEMGDERRTAQDPCSVCGEGVAGLRNCSMTRRTRVLDPSQPLLQRTMDCSACFPTDPGVKRRAENEKRRVKPWIELRKMG